MNPSEVIAVRILCFGDSNTYGYDPRGFFGDRYGAKDRWVDLLSKQTGHEVINAGTNGREIPRNPYALRLVNEHAPVDIFLVMLGTNDLLQGASAKEAAARMEAFLNPLLPHCKQFLLALNIYPQLIYDSYVQNKIKSFIRAKKRSYRAGKIPLKGYYMMDRCALRAEEIAAAACRAVGRKEQRHR